MPEQVNTPDVNANIDQTNSSTENQENNTSATNSTSLDTSVDFSKLSDEQLVKVLEDQRLWQSPRLKELREAAKKAKEYEKEKSAADEAAAIKKGEFDKVLQSKEAEIQKLSDRITNQAIDLNLSSELDKIGVLNKNAALKLIDRTKLSLNDNGQVEGVSEALEAFKSEYPELLSTKRQQQIGSSTNPVDVTNQTSFKLSEIQNPDFYQKNYKAIQMAMARGEIIDDRR